MKGERVRRLPGLDTPAQASRRPDGPAKRWAFRPSSCSSTARPTRSSRSDSAMRMPLVVAEICRRLDGLAAGDRACRDPHRPVRRRWTARSTRPALPFADRATAPGRSAHRTLMAAIDWSYNLLSGKRARRDAQTCGPRRLVQPRHRPAPSPRMGRFIGRATAVRDLATLVAGASLVAAEARDAEVKYRLCSIPPRAYALEKLVACGELDTARRQPCEPLPARGPTGKERKSERFTEMNGVERFGSQAR